jgi:transposase-like protein
MVCLRLAQSKGLFCGATMQSIESVRATIADYLEGHVTLQDACKIHNIASPTFYGWVQTYNSQNSKPPQKGFPVMAEKLKEVLGEKERAKHNRLSMDQRLLVYEAYKAGGTITQIAKRFDIAHPTARNIIETFKSLPLAMNKEPEPVVIEAPVVEAIKLVEASDIGLFFEDDMVVLKIPKAQFMKHLLKGLI